MNRIYIRNTVFTIIFLLTLTSAVMNQTGPGGTLTNAPSENNCTQCHTGSSLITSGTNHSKIFLTTGFQGNGYVPDSTYDLAVSFKQSGIAKYGFQITCLTSTGNIPAGGFTIPTGSSRIQKYTAVFSGQTRQYIGHTQTGTDTVKTDSTRWVMKWKAPSSNVGKIKFYLVVNATNSSGNEFGDLIYAKTFEFSMSPLMPVADASSVDSVTCINYDAQMKGKGTNSPTSYSWVFRGANISTSTLQNPVVKFTSLTNTMAILTVTNALGTSAPDTLKVTVRPSPTVSIPAGTTICKGDSIQIISTTSAGVTYKWSPNNKTTKNIFVKDTGTYSLTVTSIANSCATTSGNYKLNLYAKPTISITRTLTQDTFCSQINETFTASGTAFDSVHWYVNNKLFSRTKTFSLTFKSNTNSIVFAIGKSLTNCFSLNSNSYNLKVVPKIYPSNFTNNKTTNTIDLKWKKTAGIDSLKYSLNATNFFKTNTDTTLSLSGLQPSTFYNITIRSYQKGKCLFSDTTLSIRTNNCSNITYNIVMNNRICRGDALPVTITNLPKSKVSISFNNLAFAKDTAYTFSPVKSDSLRIVIIDSLALTCPPIIEKKAYLVDTFPNDPAIYVYNASSCANSFVHSISPLYQTYEFFKNNVSVSSGTNNKFTHTGLASGDKLTAKVTINSCSKTVGPVTFSISAASDAKFTFSRKGKIFTFKPTDTASNVDYKWYINDTLAGNTQNFVKDMSSYNNKTIKVGLRTANFPGCADSTEQNVVIPDFTSVANITNYNLNIFPNPFNEHVEITTNLTDYRLDIYDNLGRHIMQLNDLSDNQSLNTSDWANGMYHIVLSNDNLKLDRVLIKVN